MIFVGFPRVLHAFDVSRAVFLRAHMHEEESEAENGPGLENKNALWYILFFRVGSLSYSVESPRNTSYIFVFSFVDQSITIQHSAMLINYN